MASTGGPLTPLVGGSALATGQWEALWQGAPDWLREALVENGISDVTVLANLVADLSEVDRVVGHLLTDEQDAHKRGEAHVWLEILITEAAVRAEVLDGPTARASNSRLALGAAAQARSRKRRLEEAGTAATLVPEVASLRAPPPRPPPSATGRWVTHRKAQAVEDEGPGARKARLAQQKEKWLGYVVDILRESGWPAVERANRTLDPARTLKRSGHGRRSRTLENLVRHWWAFASGCWECMTLQCPTPRR